MGEVPWGAGVQEEAEVDEDRCRRQAAPWLVHPHPSVACKACKVLDHTALEDDLEDDHPCQHRSQHPLPQRLLAHLLMVLLVGHSPLPFWPRQLQNNKSS